MFPILLNLTGRTCVVVGGGPVACRKARALLAAGALVRLICPGPTAEDLPEVEWVGEPYDDRHLDGAALVVAAAPAEVNRRVVGDARARGLWVNAASEPESGDFALPAVLRRGPLTVAVGTDGTLPGLSRLVRDHLDGQLDDRLGALAELLAEVRPEVLRRVADPERRRRVLLSLCRWDWLDRLRDAGADAVRAEMLQELDALETLQ